MCGEELPKTCGKITENLGENQRASTSSGGRMMMLALCMCECVCVCVCVCVCFVACIVQYSSKSGKINIWFSS